MTDPVTNIPETDELEETLVDDYVEPTASEADAQDAAFAQTFRYPTSVEASPDGRYLVYLQPNDTGELELWLCETSEGASPEKVELPFVPVEDRDPDSGRLLRGPQFSPDSTRIAVTGMHPDDNRTAVWIVPVTTGAADVVVAAAGEESDSIEESAVDSSDDAIIEPISAEEFEAASDDDGSETAAEEEDEAFTEAEELAEGVAPIEEDPSVGVEDAEDSQDSVTAHAAGSEPFMLVDHAGADRSPRWSPDGEIIAFVSTIDGRDVIALGSPNEPGGMEMLTWSRDHSREPQWSRDGKFLAFLRPIAGGEGYHDIWSFSLEAGELTNLTGEKSATVRHSIEWVPGRNLVAYVTLENDWLGISVVNADNKAGWVVTRESGDKTEPRFAPSEARLIYLRNEGFTTVLCERSLHSSAAVALDPGEGVASYGRWLEPKRVAYGFSAPQKPFGFFVQENTAKSERESLSPELGGSSRDLTLRQPQPLEFKVGPDEVFSGLLYRTAGTSGKIPGIVFLPDGPMATRRGEFQIQEQALASTALAVLSPVLHGASGFGAAVENDLREFADTELEITDIAEAGVALGKEDGVDPNRIAVVGHGFGGALALVTAGARPGSFGAVVAIDPIVDWSLELANADVQWRNWVSDRFGMPFTNADTYALRTPATFNAVIDVPLILVSTASATASRRAQMEALTADLDEMGVEYTTIEAPEEPIAATLRRVSQQLAAVFMDGREEADVVGELSTDDI